MSVGEDIELRDLLAQTLEENGCIAKIKAQLRASIFLALDEDIKLSSKEPMLNTKVKNYLESSEGQVMFCIVKEFLDFFNLFYTLSVYEPESYLGTAYKYNGRQKVLKDLGLDEKSTLPILLQLVKIAQAKSRSIEINLNLNGNGHNKSELETSSNIKTESSTSLPLEEENSYSRENETKHKVNSTLNASETRFNQSKEENKTFEIRSPSVALKNAQPEEIKEITEKQSSLITENDDTFEDTSSIAEDSIKTGSKGESNITNGNSENNEISQPILKEIKMPPQKSKGGLSSLTDLPPLPMSKSRVAGDILPTPYSKELKEKSNLRELDKLFDMQTEYEEDFMCGGDLSLTEQNLKSAALKINLNEEKSKSKSLRSSKEDGEVNSDPGNSTSKSISENLEFNTMSD
ncbi:unnamed protein product [Brassicogethes aeneus]|uniref:FGFR1 oncogene partner (FOP) N-terminal dimerisation domain-containing protein n=1 Tax=Brassicogethes aeneus TaxID=1431903 RepID=A0A9P0AQD9_BRAAE|nr:unnamed protein product [Brassicogethes aeneus]